ncbi:MAG TPA: hypothetical protein VK672_08265, partial [Solirubrobacteraceae bacterium]|nr:hypothetical protein [Solirubrobacteraceae bacterium]
MPTSDPDTRGLVLCGSPDACLTLAAHDLGDDELRVATSSVGRASREAIVLPDGMASLPESQWSSLLEWCRASVKPDGVLVLRSAHASAPEVESLRTALAGHFGAVELFYWDGMRRASTAIGDAELFAVCRPFLPYPIRSLELLRPRLVAGAEWQSSWLCEGPAL